MPLFDFDGLNLLTSLVIVMGIQLVFFALAAVLRSDVFTDITYSLIFALVAILLLSTGGLVIERVLATALIAAWSLRLGIYLLVRILRTGTDRRFDGIRESPLRFGLFWLGQGLTIWIVLLPATMALSRTGRWFEAWAAVAGGLVWAAGLVIETVADLQKYRFRNREENRGRWIQTGLWRRARHPNYFGEMLCWWGLFVLVTPALEGWMWLGAAGPVFITVLLRYGTGIPTVQKQHREKYGHLPEYQDYLRRTRLLVPLPKRVG